ncbi:MAG TPA: sensor histidine kinase [Verrucomicrobiae bacterium]|nr:sensor histidine kinase [Verrucomicrobiae bacterium]
MKTRTTFVIAFAVFSAAIVAAGAGYYHHLKEYLYATRLKELAAIADLKVRDISSWRSERLADARVLATNPAISRFVAQARSGGTTGSGIVGWLDAFRDSYGYEGVLVADAGGSVLASSPAGRVLDPPAKALLTPSRATAVFSDLYRNGKGRPCLAVCAAVRPRIGPAKPAGYIASAIPSINADPSCLERVFLNLLTKYSPAESAVELTAVSTQQNVVITVTDRGEGVPPEDLPYIFERFYMAEHGRNAGGLGLGLYITKTLVEAHGGSAGVESDERGSTFTVTLPLPAKDMAHS